MRYKSTKKNMLIWLIVISTPLLFLRGYSTLFVYPLVLIELAAVALCPLSVCMPLLCFLLPFANIIKFQPGQISLFTIFFLVYVVRIVFKTGTLKRQFLIAALFFGGYCLVFSGIGKIVVIVTMICGFAMVHEVCESDEYDYESVLYAFCAGLLMASILALLKDNLPLINGFVIDRTHKVGHEEYVARFAGLHGNPNYYTMDTSVALSCLVVTMCTSRQKPIQVLLFAVLSVFGLMSISKSFLLVWVILLMILLYFGAKNGGSTFFKLIAVIAVTTILVINFAQESIDTYIFRLTQDSGGDLSSVTTGRSDILITYIKKIASGEKILLFGKGLGEILDQGTHNTYIEFFYYLGIVGSLFYFYALKSSVALKKFPSNLIYYVPIVLVLVRFLGIGMLIQDSLWYYMALICLLLKAGVQAERRFEVSDGSAHS